MYLTAFIWAEFILRVVIELREARAVQQHVSVFTLMRLLPLINDFVPLPENREPPALGRFVEMHEQGHKVLHHALLRNLVKVAFALVAIWRELIRCEYPHTPLFALVYREHPTAVLRMERLLNR